MANPLILSLALEDRSLGKKSFTVFICSYIEFFFKGEFYFTGILKNSLTCQNRCSCPCFFTVEIHTLNF